MEALEGRRLLDGAGGVDINPAVLPNPTIDFDPGAATLVDLDTFTVNSNSLEMEAVGYILPGSIAGMDDGDKAALIAKINEERDNLLEQLDDQIAVVQRVKNAFTGIRTFLTLQRADSQAEYDSLGNTLADQDRRAILSVVISFETTAINRCNAIINALANEITFLNNYKTRVNEAFDRVISNIEELNVAADPWNYYFPWYYSHNEAIG